MDKHSLSNYGWTVVALIIVTIFTVIAFAVGDSVVDSTINVLPPTSNTVAGTANVSVSKPIAVTVNSCDDNSFEYTIGEGEFDFVRIYKNDKLVTTLCQPDVASGTNLYDFAEKEEIFIADDIIKIECYKGVDTVIGSAVKVFKLDCAHSYDATGLCGECGDQIVKQTGLIKESWQKIISYVNDGTYSLRYAVGAYKPLDLGSEGVIEMQIAAIDADMLSDGTGYAHITWVAKSLLISKYAANSANTNEGGWGASDVRTYLHNNVWDLINPDVRRAIVTVNKTYYDNKTGSTLVSADKIWVPSCREVGFGTSLENSGAMYSDIFTDVNSRIRYSNGTAYRWWLRSADLNNNYSFYDIKPDGNFTTNSAYYELGVLVCFCF